MGNRFITHEGNLPAYPLFFGELDANAEACDPILKAVRPDRVIFVFSSRDAERNNAVALKEHPEAKMGSG